MLSKNCGLPFPSFFPVDLPASSLDANKTCLHMLSQWLRLSLDNDCSKLTMLSLMSARKRGSTSASNNVNSTPETDKTVMNKGKREQQTRRQASSAQLLFTSIKSSSNK